MKTETRTLDVLRQWFFEERVVAFTLKNSSRENIDRFADWIIETLENWPVEKPLLIAYDLSTTIFTPQARKRALEVYEAVPTTVQGRTAIVFPKNALGNFMKIFANKSMRVQNPRMERRFFVNLDEAAAWLNEFRSSTPSESEKTEGVLKGTPDEQRITNVTSPGST
ncbi:MAG: hypothetical protein KJ064_21950 [Anaerolineae bacterium]|nr:hypothetical protein [Anaerolineae bacterium]